MNLDAKLIFEEFRNILKNDKDNIQKVRNVPIPAKSIKAETDRVSITATTFADEADITIRNPWDQKARIIAISTIPDSTARTNGQFKILINEVSIFSIETTGDLTEYSSIPVSLPNEGVEIDPIERVELFGRTSSGTSVFNLYVTFQRSE